MPKISDEFKKIHVFDRDFDTWKPSSAKIGSGSCLNHALSEAGINTNIPNWTRTWHLPEICDELGLNFSKKGILTDGKPYILSYETEALEGERIGHCEFTTRAPALLEEIGGDDNLIAVIEIPEDF